MMHEIPTEGQIGVDASGLDSEFYYESEVIESKMKPAADGGCETTILSYLGADGKEKGILRFNFGVEIEQIEGDE